MLVRSRSLLTTRESARQQRFEPVSSNSATNVQKAIEATASAVGTARLPASGGTIQLFNSDIEVGINTTSGAVNVDLPGVSAWAAANNGGLELTIFDLTGHAATHNISFVLLGSDTFVQGVAPVINANYGLLKLRPILGASNQWFIRGVN